MEEAGEAVAEEEDVEGLEEEDSMISFKRINARIFNFADNCLILSSISNTDPISLQKERWPTRLSSLAVIAQCFFSDFFFCEFLFSRSRLSSVFQC